MTIHFTYPQPIKNAVACDLFSVRGEWNMGSAEGKTS